MDILKPPKSYIDWRDTLHSWENNWDSNKEQFDSIRNKFYKNFPEAEEEIKSFCNWLHQAKHDMSLPVENVEVYEMDGKKHGRVVKMMIYDIEWWREGTLLKRRKSYIPLEPLYNPPCWDDISWNPANIKKEIKNKLEAKDAEEFERKRQIAKEKLKELS